MSPKSEPAKSASTLISAAPLVNRPQELGESGLPPPSDSQPLGYTQFQRPSGELNLTNSLGAGTAPPHPETTSTPGSAQTIAVSRPQNDRVCINLSSLVRGMSSGRAPCSLGF